MTESSDLARLQRQVAHERERYLRIVEVAPDALLTVENERVTYANNASIALFGARSLDDILGRNPFDFFAPEQRQEIRKRHRAIAQAHDVVVMSEETVTRLDGSTIPVQLRVFSYLSETGLVVQSAFRDLSDQVERHAAEAQLRYLAHHDVTTGLPNRHYFEGHIAELLARGSAPFLLLNIGIDGFSDVNDSYGVSFGDSLLQHIAMTIRSELGYWGERALLVRHRGDEFMLVLEGEDDLAFVAKLGAVLRARFDRAMQVERREIYVSVSIGAASYPQHATGFEELLRCVDIAMHEVKREGGDGFRVFLPEMAERQREKLRIETELRSALERGAGLRLEYQPIIRASTGRIDSAEALLRWDHPKFGPVSPEVFVPIAEESGLAVALGSWVLHAAVAQLREWQEDGLTDFPVAVNVSAKQFAHHDLAAEVLDVLSRERVDTSRLKIELTETAIAKNLVRVRNQLERLRRRGVESAIDDYGTGYSNLNYLNDLPTDYVKIDRSFVAALSGERGNTSDIIVRNVIDVVQSLDGEVIAEGVETLQQAEILRGFGCDYLQGWAFGRSMPPGEFAALMRRDPTFLGETGTLRTG